MQQGGTDLLSGCRDSDALQQWLSVSDRYSAYNHLPTQQRQLCWAHLIRDLTAISERSGASVAFGAQLLELQQQLFVQWHR